MTQKTKPNGWIILLIGLLLIIQVPSKAQQYVNGNLSTGANSSNGTAAPAGFTWCEVQAGNVNAGFGSSIANNQSLADDFTVPTASWNVSKLTFFAYSTGYTGTTSPFTELRFQIFNTDPSVGTPTPIFGDLVTNRLTSSSSALMYRIFNTVTGTTRLIWKLEANVNISLLPGTYWIEWQTGVTTGLTSNFTPPSTVVGTTTQAGNNGKQHDMAANTWTNVVDGTTIANNFQDFHFIIDYATAACTGTPAPGNTTASVISACPGTSFSLGISNLLGGSGISNQWQSAVDLNGTPGTWSNISGATGTTCITSLTSGGRWFRLVSTCSSTGLSGYSTPVLVSQAPALFCFCASNATSANDDEILLVKIGTLENSSNCTTLAPGPGSVQNKYSNYTSGTGAPAPGIILSGGANPFSIEVGTCAGNYNNSTSIWIDYNQNGAFETSEQAYLSPGATQGPHTETGVINIPTSSVLGTTLMRVVTVETGTPANITACGTYTWGETEDYLVTIRNCIPVVFTSQPASVTTSCNGTVLISVAASGDNPTFSWQERANATSAWTTVIDGGFYSGANTSTLTISSINSSLNGRQYRALLTGSCTAVDFSNTATLTVNPLPAQVTPTTATICGGSAQSIQILNSTSTNLLKSASSGTVSQIIFDNNPSGIVTLPLTIAGIPANALINDISIKFNITHNWVGDIDLNLIAPNGQIINLVGSLNNGTGSNGTANFTNSVVSSSVTNSMSGVAAPRTGTFAADKLAGFGPTGYLQNVSDWSGLTQMNGDWKLAIVDHAAGDEGVLVDWQISISYTTSQYAIGTWSPVTSLFTDPNLTIAYSGTAVNTVYAAPTATTNYTVVVQTINCTSNPLSIPINVSAPSLTRALPYDSAICQGCSTVFTCTANLSNAAQFQWQVSVNGGLTYSNLTNSPIYSGVNTATLSITGADITMNGNKYRLFSTFTGCTSTAYSAPFSLFVGIPIIYSFTPTIGHNGTIVEIYGDNFSDVSQVKFGNTNATWFSVVSTTLIRAIVGLGATGNVTVSSASGTTFSPGFIYYPAPTISTATPNPAAIGDTVIITGSNFTGVTDVSFGGIRAFSFIATNDNSIRAVLGASFSGPLTVTTPGGTATYNNFAFNPTSPVRLNIVSQSTNCNSIITVPVKASGFNNLLSLQASIGWDQSKLNFLGIEQYGPANLALSSANFGTTNSSNGVLTFLWNDADLSGESLPDSSTLFVIRFQVLTNTGTSSIQLLSTPTAIEAINTNFEPVSCYATAGNVNVSCSQSNDFSFIAPVVSTTCGSTIDIPIKVTRFNGILSFQGSFTWDTSKIRFQNISGFGPASLMLSSGNFGTNNTGAGKITFSWNDLDLSGETLTDSTIIFTLRFLAANVNNTTSYLSFSNIPTSIEVVNTAFNTVPYTTIDGFCTINCFSNIYTFNGNGNWTNASNWLNNSVPPSLLPSGSQIIIDPIVNGECLLNTQQTISQGAIIRIKTGKKLRVENNLQLQ